MDLQLTDTDGSVFGSILAAIAAVGAFIGWWFHVRRLTRADRIDSGVSKSIEFVLAELRKEIGRLSAENIELRGRILANDARWEALQKAVQEQ